MFEIVYKINVLNDKSTLPNGRYSQVDDIEGVALWYLAHVPTASDLRTTFGFKAEFSGVGAFLLKH